MRREAERQHIPKPCETLIFTIVNDERAPTRLLVQFEAQREDCFEAQSMETNKILFWLSWSFLW